MRPQSPPSGAQSHALEGGQLRLVAASSRVARENVRSVIPDERGKREAVVAQIPKDVTPPVGMTAIADCALVN